MRKNWVGVVSAEHVARGREGHFIQVCHGKSAPLKRIKAGDRFAYYSPVISFGGKADPSKKTEKCQSFTAIGTVRDDHVYQYDMGGGFVPFRRDMDWWEAKYASILPLLEQLEFTRGRKSWGYAFRFGLLEVSDADMDVIAEAMGVTHPPFSQAFQQDPS